MKKRCFIISYQLFENSSMRLIGGGTTSAWSDNGRFINYQKLQRAIRKVNNFNEDNENIRALILNIMEVSEQDMEDWNYGLNDDEKANK